MGKDNFTKAIKYREEMGDDVSWTRSEDFKKIFRCLEENGLRANMPSQAEVDFSGYLKHGGKVAMATVEVYKSKKPSIEMKMYMEIDAARFSGYGDIEKVFQSWKKKTEEKIEKRFRSASGVPAEIVMTAKIDSNPYVSDIIIRGDDSVKLIKDAKTIIKNLKGTRYEPLTSTGN